MELFGKLCAGMIAFTIFICLFGLLVGYPLMWLWNGIMVPLTKGAVTEISFWGALGLWLLSSTLFKSCCSTPSSK